MSNNTCSQSILVSLGSAAPAVSHLKAELEQYWNSSKSVPTYKLQPVSDTSTSDVEKLLASSKLKAVINTVAQNFAKKRDEKPKEFADTLLRFPLLPLPVITSKTFLLFNPDGAPALQNSYEVLRMSQIILNEVNKVSKLDKHTKQKFLTTLEETLNNTIDFISNTIARLHLMPWDAELADLLLRENYYAMLNVIRIWEFTTLDLLSVPQKFQSHLVSQIEYDPRIYRSTSTFDDSLIAEIFGGGKDKSGNGFMKSFVAVYGNKAGPISDSLMGSTAKWPTDEAAELFSKISKVALNNQLFWCGNHEVCNKKERKLGEFKKCARCSWVRYCSRECQTMHWTTKHKAVCLKKLDEKGLEEFFKGRRIIISSDEDEHLQREDKDENSAKDAK